MNAKPLSGFLMGICAVAGASASTCNVGSFDPLNGSSCQPAPIGSFVGTAGASAATLAPPGTFVASTGASAPTPAPIGSFVNVFGAAQATPAPPGYFVGATGSTAAQAAPVGFYVATTGASSATPAPIGTFVANTGASSATPAPIGTFVASTGAATATPAPPGTFVASTGASAPTPAPLGFFVDMSGAAQATPAPPGYFVGATGSTAAQAAPVGFYVATTGASAPTPVASGFYTATSAATAGIGAGLMASPLNIAIDATQGILSEQKNLLSTPQQSLDVAVSGRRTRFDQIGLNARNDLSLNSTTVVIQHTVEASPQAWKFFGGLADHQLKATTAGSGQARTWLLGASRGLRWGQAEPLQASVYAGQSSADMSRNITELSAAETQAHSASVRVMGLRMSTSVPMPTIFAKLLVETGMVHYTQTALSENGNMAGTLGGLRVDKYAQWAAPIFIGLEHPLGALNLQWGLRADLTPQHQLKASLNNGANYNFALPVGLSSTQAFVAKLRIREMDMGQGFALSGGANMEAGKKVRHQQVQVVLAKRW